MTDVGPLRNYRYATNQTWHLSVSFTCIAQYKYGFS